MEIIITDTRTMAAEPIRKRGKNWSLHETETLISVWRNYDHKLQNFKRNLPVYDQIHEDLVGLGVTRSAKDTKARLKLLSTRYRKEKANVIVNNAPSKWEYYNILDEFVDKPITPSLSVDQPKEEQDPGVDQPTSRNSNADSESLTMIWSDEEDGESDERRSLSSSFIDCGPRPTLQQQEPPIQQENNNQIQVVMEAVLKELRSNHRASQELTNKLIEALASMQQLNHSLLLMLMAYHTTKSVPVMHPAMHHPMLRFQSGFGNNQFVPAFQLNQPVHPLLMNYPPAQRNVSSSNIGPVGQDQIKDKAM